MHTRTASAALMLLLGSCTSGPPLAAQAPLTLVDSETEVRSIEFRFLDHRTFGRARLLAQLSLREPGSIGEVRRRLSFLPLVSAGSYPFRPLELQRDLVRLRRFYTRSGFPAREITYDAVLDTTSNRISIRFEITEGEPRVRGPVVVTNEEGRDPGEWLPDSLAAEWPNLIGDLRPPEGGRLGDFEVLRIESQVVGWFRERGYPFATANVVLVPGGPDQRVNVHFTLRPGDRLRIGSVSVDGPTRLSERTILRELDVRPGTWFSSVRVAEGVEQVFGLDIVRRADAEPVARPSPDSLVDVRARVEEGPPRLVSGTLGYASESGVSGQADWAHRDFLGGARTLSISAQGRTGALGFGPTVQRRYSLSWSVKQPYLFDRRTALLVVPVLEYNDDYRDRSVQLSSDVTVVHEWGSLRYASLQFSMGRRQVLDFRVVGSDDLDALGSLTSVGRTLRTATLVLSGSAGNVDDPLSPRTGYLLRGGAEITGPESITSTQYRRLELSAVRFASLSARTGVVFRVSAGRLWPFGKSVPAPGESPTEQLRLMREALFTGGGRYDVRGWGEQQLGPKLPDARLETSGADTLVLVDRYVPMGGLARLTGSLEVRLPLPGTSRRFGTHVFLDTGRVWTPDERFDRGESAESGFYYSLGSGLELGTPFGPVRLSVGYKLNPSPSDLRDPGAVYAAIASGQPITSVPADSGRRWHLHLVIGSAF